MGGTSRISVVYVHHNIFEVSLKILMEHSSPRSLKLGLTEVSEPKATFQLFDDYFSSVYSSVPTQGVA